MDNGRAPYTATLIFRSEENVRPATTHSFATACIGRLRRFSIVSPSRRLANSRAENTNRRFLNPLEPTSRQTSHSVLVECETQERRERERPIDPLTRRFSISGGEYEFNRRPPRFFRRSDRADGRIFAGSNGPTNHRWFIRPASCSARLPLPRLLPVIVCNRCLWNSMGSIPAACAVSMSFYSRESRRGFL